jgi:hypothetical protein
VSDPQQIGAVNAIATGDGPVQIAAAFAKQLHLAGRGDMIAFVTILELF